MADSSAAAKLPNFTAIRNVETLQLLASDLSRRLENANNTVEAQRRVAKNSIATAERCRRNLTESSTLLRLEMAKSDSQRRQKMKEDEANNFEMVKRKRRIILDKLRLAELDYQITPSARSSRRIDQMKAQISSLESNQESQKRLLTHLVTVEKMTEDLSSAAQNGDFNACSSLLRQGAGLNNIDSSGFLPIHYACSAGSEQIVKLLCEFGSDPSSYLTGHSAIEIAARHGQIKVIQILLSFGAKMEDKGTKGCPPIISAAANNQMDTIIFLLSIGADINCIDANEETCLHVATRLPDPLPMAIFLMRKGADLEAQNALEETPLEAAHATNNSDLIRALGGE